MNKLSCLLIILFVWLQYLLWFGKNGVYDLIIIFNSIKNYQNINNFNHMKIRNNQLLYEIYDLHHGFNAIEERARFDLGMVKSDETFYYTEYK
ncbi:septum formation initiator family protein [Candidatus Blochmannia ocreatus (nom. nud.)]|uniref:Cell division protein FtsB n=1 Tax=Candidatus Blochmannia ocreatus (nom. nud.) TaxID=251538 RepID=A0ABY4STE6_9ENTR|nr:septum formation initiator family protein [Candidatus Blochmannia ocreatus]URJ25247.1 septum formation initiator family protein [Candidatus Blochmannia ocreatus]